MKEVTLRIADNKLSTFLAFIQDLEYVEILEDETDTENSDAQKVTDNFFDLAGMWQGRDISAKDLRKKAWPLRK